MPFLRSGDPGSTPRDHDVRPYFRLKVPAPRKVGKLFDVDSMRNHQGQCLRPSSRASSRSPGALKEDGSRIKDPPREQRAVQRLPPGAYLPLDGLANTPCGQTPYDCTCAGERACIPPGTGYEKIRVHRQKIGAAGGMGSALVQRRREIPSPERREADGSAADSAVESEASSRRFVSIGLAEGIGWPAIASTSGVPSRSQGAVNLARR